MKALVAGAGLFLSAAFLLIFFTRVSDFATSGDLSGDAQTVFDTFPQILMILAAFIGVGGIIALVRAGFGR